MRINCESLFAGADKRLPIDYRLSLTEREVFADFEPTAPVLVTGEIVNRAGVVTCTLHITLTLRQSCDRCAESFERAYEIDSENVLVTSVNADEPDDYVVIPDAMLDVDELVESCVLLELPSKVLCKPDCLGLCPQCGQNLNIKTCSCQKQSVDPRLEALRQLLE